MSDIRVAVIGAGGMGSLHLRELQRFEDVFIAAVVDSDLAKARAAAHASGARAYDDYRTMLEHEPLDAVYICTPPFSRGAIELELAERDLPFFIEKPLALDLATAEDVSQHVTQRGIVTSVGHQWRYLDVTDCALQRLTATAPRLLTGYWLSSLPAVEWWPVEELSGGQLLEQAVHILDLARVFMGEVHTVYAAGARASDTGIARGNVHDVSLVTLHFESGALGVIVAACFLPGRYRIGLEVLASSLVLEMSEFELTIRDGHEPVTIKADRNPYTAEDRIFIDAVRGGTNLIRVPYLEALQSHRLATLAVRSLREGCPLSVPG